MFCMFKTASIARKTFDRRLPRLSQNIRNIAGKSVNEEEMQKLHEMHKKAVGYNESGNTAMAAPLLKTLTEKKHTSTIAYLGVQALRQGKLKEALNHFQFCANIISNRYIYLLSNLLSIEENFFSKVFCMLKTGGLEQTASNARKTFDRRLLDGKAVNEEEMQKLHEMHQKAVGYHQSGNKAMAAPLLKTLTEKKHTSTIAFLGALALQQGKLKEAMNHFQFSAKQEPTMYIYDREHIGWSCYILADSYLEGKNGVRKDLREGSKLLQKAVDLGNIEAIGLLGEILLDGHRGFAKNEDRGVELLQIAAKEGNTWAQHRLGSVYFRGNSVLQKNLDLCIEYWKIAAEKEFHMALFELGMLYYNGHQDGNWNIPKDTALAASYLRKFLKLNQFDSKFASLVRKAQKIVNELHNESTTKKRK